jgi:hypothetical protein
MILGCFDRLVGIMLAMRGHLPAEAQKLCPDRINWASEAPTVRIVSQSRLVGQGGIA